MATVAATGEVEMEMWRMADESELLTFLYTDGREFSLLTRVTRAAWRLAYVVTGDAHALVK
jgi:hypothetical protein